MEHDGAFVWLDYDDELTVTKTTTATMSPKAENSEKSQKKRARFRFFFARFRLIEIKEKSFFSFP